MFIFFLSLIVIQNLVRVLISYKKITEDHITSYNNIYRSKLFILYILGLIDFGKQLWGFPLTCLVEHKPSTPNLEIN